MGGQFEAQSFDSRATETMYFRARAERGQETLNKVGVRLGFVAG